MAPPGVVVKTPGGETLQTPWGYLSTPPFGGLPPGCIVRATVAAEPAKYGDRLRAALESKDWSQARLVKALAKKTGNAPESERSAVRGYLRDSVPRPERAALIAEVMGVPELALVEHPRESGTARLERRLEELAENQARLLDNQRKGVASLTAQLRAVQRTLQSLAEDANIEPKQSRRGAR